jgi:hypothetical protein
LTKVIQTQKTTLAGSGITAADTSIILNSFKLPDGTTITNTDLSTINYATLEPGTSREEQISFTGVTQNIDGTATITGVVRGVRMVDPYDEVSGNKFPHAGGTVLVITNTAGFYNKFTTRTEAESVSGQWEFDTLPQSSATPVADEDLATKAYVDATATGTTTTDRLVVEGTAGETVAAGNLVYLKTSDARWWKCDADLTATLFGVQLGIAQGAGTAGNLIAGGVLKKGLSAVHSGLTANSLYYASNTAGAIATSAGTNSRTIGQSRTTSTLYFDPDFNSASNGLPTSFVSTSAGAADSGKGAVLNASGLLDKTLTNPNC